MKEVVVIDFLNKGNSHANFNSALIESLKGNSVLFYANSSHIDSLHVNNTNLRPVTEMKANWALQVVRIFLKSSLTFKKKHYLIACSDNYILPILTVLFFPFFLNKNISFILHNNIEPLIRSKKKRIPLKLASKLLNYKFICLTNNSEKAMNSIGFKKTSFIPHMNFSIYKKIAKKVNIEFPANMVNIIFIGRQAKFFVEKILPKINISSFNNLNFIILYKEKIPHNISNIDQITNWITNEELNFSLSKADYCFFHNHEVKYRPSGVLLDSISNNCPVIAPDYGHFSETQEQKIGLYYKDIETLMDLFEKLNHSQSKRKDYKQEGFVVAKNQTSLDNFTKKINSVI